MFADGLLAVFLRFEVQGWNTYEVIEEEYAHICEHTHTRTHTTMYNSDNFLLVLI